MLQQMAQSKQRTYESVFNTKSLGSFTNKLILHGMKRDTTLEAATREKKHLDRAKALREMRMVFISSRNHGHFSLLSFRLKSIGN
jgi:hypothetical protein